MKLKPDRELWEIEEAAREEAAAKAEKPSETWAQDCIEDLDDWIEQQGIYLRQ